MPGRGGAPPGLGPPTFLDEIVSDTTVHLGLPGPDPMLLVDRPGTGPALPGRQGPVPGGRDPLPAGLCMPLPPGLACGTPPGFACNVPPGLT